MIVAVACAALCTSCTTVADRAKRYAEEMMDAYYEDKARMKTLSAEIVEYTNILSGEDNCSKRKILRSADTSSRHFVNTIYENMFNDISIERLADLTNRSLTSFKKEFRRIFDSSPHHWIIGQRLSRAKIMLSSTSRTVSEIGAECGFANISHFIKLFKQRYNCTPASYRRTIVDVEETRHSEVG